MEDAPVKLDYGLDSPATIRHWWHRAGWSFTIGCYESNELYDTRVDALEALITMLDDDVQRLTEEIVTAR